MGIPRPGGARRRAARADLHRRPAALPRIRRHRDCCPAPGTSRTRPTVRVRGSGPAPAVRSAAVLGVTESDKAGRKGKRGAASELLRAHEVLSVRAEVLRSACPVRWRPARMCSSGSRITASRTWCGRRPARACTRSRGCAWCLWRGLTAWPFGRPAGSRTPCSQTSPVLHSGILSQSRRAEPL